MKFVKPFAAVISSTVKGGADYKSNLAGLYSANTAGGIAGIIFAAFLFIEKIGVLETPSLTFPTDILIAVLSMVMLEFFWGRGQLGRRNPRRLALYS